MYGNAYARGTHEYEERRPVHNGACRNIYPAIIAVPHSTEDVSLAVKTAVQGSILQSSISAENFSDKFHPHIFGTF
jgi:hypothetical protein